MIKIKQFRYSKDNFAYLLHVDNEAVAIDPGCPDDIVKFMMKNNLNLRLILNTHSHYDHTLGNKKLEKKTGVSLKKYEDLSNLKVGGVDINVIQTPGHTADSVCFQTDNFIVTGDTLFIANIGNCPDSMLSVYKESLAKLLLLSDSLIVYPGHDYTERSLKRVQLIEPENKDIEIFIRKYNPPPVFTTIGDEKRINPYLRANTNVIKEHLNSKGKSTRTEFDCFKSFMELY